jgi:microcystin degradation protein MlrC
MYDVADAMLKGPHRIPGVLSNSIALGFPYADVEEMGSGFIVVTDNDKPLAQKLANQLADYLIEHRAEFKGKFTSVEEALDEALAGKGPVCLLDMGDNVGGGSAADGTVIAQAIQRRHETGEGFRAFVAIYDPESQAAARQAKIGNKLRLKIGGKTDKLHGPPLEVEATVRSLHEGKFSESEVRHGGLRDFVMGPTAIVETDGGLTIQLTSERVFPCSLGQLASCGLRVEDFQVVVAKGVQAPVAAYGPVCTKLIRVNTPGATTADMEMLTYQHRRKPLYPFEEI